MIEERAIQRHQSQVIDLALRQEESVERITSLRRGMGPDNHMPYFDW